MKRYLKIICIMSIGLLLSGCEDMSVGEERNILAITERDKYYVLVVDNIASNKTIWKESVAVIRADVSCPILVKREYDLNNETWMIKLPRNYKIEKN
jgi:hypothetical protein